MALKLNCIFNQPSALPDVIKLVEKTAHSLNAKKRSAKVEDVYRKLREDNFEIDAESVAFAYSQVQGILGKKNFSSKADVNRFGGESLKKAITIAQKGTISTSKTGRESISNSVALGVANIFSGLKGRNNVNQTRLSELQIAVKKAVMAKLDRSGIAQPKQTASFQDILRSAFEVENLGATGQQAMKGKVKSGMSSMDEIWAAVQDDLNTISSKLNPVERAEFDQMTEQIRNSSYDLLLSSRESDDVIKGILKTANPKYIKNVNGKDVVDWNEVLSSDKPWREEFTSVLTGQGGFSISESRRIIDKLDANYTKALSKQAENKLKQIAKKNNTKKPIKKDAIDRLMKLRNAGLFAPNNRSVLYEAMGMDIPDEVADEVANLIRQHELATKQTGKLSNVEAEEVVRSIKNLLHPLTKDGMDRITDVINDYTALRASSTISTAFNAAQNITSGLFQSIQAALVATLRTGNPKLLAFFASNWLSAARDVSLGGVTIRDAQTINALDQLQGRGGLSDRWTWDSAKGLWGYVKAGLNALAQITATAADAANGTAIYQAGIITGVKDVLRSKGMNPKQINAAIDDIIFGKHPSGKTNRQVWKEEAHKRLNDLGDNVVSRGTKARRIGDELIWHKLVTDYGLTIEEVKAIQGSSLDQKSRDLGHQSDIIASPSFFLEAINKGILDKSEDAKTKGNRGEFMTYQLMGTIFRSMNMFVGGKANWAILTLQNSPIGAGIVLVDLAWKESLAKVKGGDSPLYRQALDFDDPKRLREQLAARKALSRRVTRAVAGSVIQYALYGILMQIIGANDDEEERSKALSDTFGKLYKDPDTKRAMDKILPAMLAAELQYAYDWKTGKLDEKKLSDSWLLPKYGQSVQGIIEYAGEQVSGPTGFDLLNDQLGYAEKIPNEAERSERKAELKAAYVGGLLNIPYTSWFNIERNEFRVFENGGKPDPNEFNKRRAYNKKLREEVNGSTDAFIKGLTTLQLYDYIKNGNKNKR